MTRQQQRAPAVKVETLPTQVAAHLARRIAAAQFRGDRAPSELEIAEEFEVSRAVAREALKLLASLDMVEIAQGRRIVVRPSTEWDYLNPLLIEWLPEEYVEALLAELHEMRLLLEPELAARAATTISAEALAALRTELDRMASLEAAPDDYLEVDHAFHMAICRAANNRILDRIMYAARWLLVASRRVTNTAPGSLPSATAAHTEIFSALAARDPAAAREAMRAHLERNVFALAGTQHRRSSPGRR
jgi:DNA-binding FadR family transcriptional regulator